ncbi:TPA: hypothetical protein N0F65_007161 [Lagenidium giganteum]|uniref:Rieske domain-containing protein n=1 Tax=Lagenidium giganteum TaxID=4803 RepID=A0AAV2Z9N0_9STRA|nr:TPA: hypothetical protein N0F65_007161 [Lagenidium giganteum]
MMATSTSTRPRPLDAWTQIAYEPANKKKDVSDVLFWVDSGVPEDEVLEASDHLPQYEFTVTGRRRVKGNCAGKVKVGRRVELYGRPIAIFKYYDQLYAIDNKCPHQGGSLELGDIEDIDGQVCVSCPRHHWPFSLEDGKCIIGVKYRAQTYPIEARQQPDGSKSLYIGFPFMPESFFEDNDF